MLRHFIQPFVRNYGSIKADCFHHPILKKLSLNTVKKGAMSSGTCLQKKEQTKQIGIFIGLLSGCCFSKGADDYEPILETSEPIEQALPVTQKLAAAAQNLVSEMKKNSVSMDLNEEVLDKKTFSGCTDNKDKNVDAEPKVAADKIDDAAVVLSENAVANSDEDVVYKCTDKSKRQKLSKKMKKAIGGDGASETEDKSVKRKPARVIPNYFVAFQITNPEIRNAMKEVQNYVTLQDKRLASSMEPISKSHITLMVMHLNEEEHSKALDVLKDIHKEFSDAMHATPLVLQFTGVGHFGNKVVFAKLQEDRSLQRLRLYAERIRYHFSNADLMSTDSPSKQFNPHLTIMKLSKDPTLFRKGVKKINPAFYKAYENHSFGVEIVKGIQLLSMQDPLNENGYYQGACLPFDVPDDDGIDKNANF